MVRKPDIEYVNKYYVYGSEAKIIEFKTSGKHPKTTLPKPIQEKKLTILVDPVALFGLVVAVFMMVVMVIGLGDFKNACLEKQAMERYVTQLQDENIMLKHTYRNSYDLHKVEETALALGMVHASEVTTTKIVSEIPLPEAENTWWDDFLWQLSILFANA